MCAYMFNVLLVVFMLVGSVGLEFHPSLSLASEWYSPRQAEYCPGSVYVCVCFYECVHVAVGLWGSLCSVLAVCVIFGSAPVWQVVGVCVCTFADARDVRKWVFMAVVYSVCEESVLLVCVAYL